jgi:molecular chaperone DnaK (HSP70)
MLLMLNKDELIEFLDSFEYVSKKTEALLQELSSFKDTDIKIKEEINNLKSLLSKFNSLEDKLKEDVSLVVKQEVKKILEENKADITKQIKIVNYLVKKLEKLETFKSNCIYYFFAGILIGLIPLLLVYFNILKI